MYFDQKQGIFPMWPKSYKDYPKDTPLVKQRVESGKGIIGCEMSEPNGWGESYHNPVSSQDKNKKVRKKT
jgi:hypothetical protein